MATLQALSPNVSDYISTTLLAEWDEINFMEELEGGNALFFIKPTIVFSEGQAPYVTYGIFSRKTGVMESDSRQLHNAQEWVIGLTALVNGDPLPGLDSVTTLDQAEATAEE